MDIPEFTVSLKGKFRWELLIDIDNTANPNPASGEKEMVGYVETNYLEIIHSIQSSPEYFGASLRAPKGSGLLNVTCIGVKGDPNCELKDRYDKIIKERVLYNKTTRTTTTDTFDVAAKSILQLYRLEFTGSGLRYSTDILSPYSDPVPDVHIQFKARMLPVVKCIEVIYTSESDPIPEDIIKEARGHSSDINQGHGGTCVWLRPVWTFDWCLGPIGTELVVQSEEEEGYKNLAPGREGDFRYLKMLRGLLPQIRITEIALWRRVKGSGDSELPDHSDRYRFRTENINEGREGEDDLFLVWNVTETN